MAAIYFSGFFSSQWKAFDSLPRTETYMFYDEAVHSAFDAFALSTSYVLFTLFMLVLDIFSRQFSAQPSISSGETFQYFIQGATFFFWCPAFWMNSAQTCMA